MPSPVTMPGKTLSWPHLIALCVGAIVGTGVYTLTGVSAEHPGPAVIFAYAVACAVCACAALAYRKLAMMIPTAGSAHTFSYAALGAKGRLGGWAEPDPEMLAGLFDRRGRLVRLSGRLASVGGRPYAGGAA